MKDDKCMANYFLTVAAFICMIGNEAVGNAQGQVLGTCVGTGMGFDPAFYYYRPVSPYAAHGYGPVIFAGAEVIRLLATSHPRLNDSAIQFYTDDMSSFGPIFGVEK